ncbi:MAG: hypothetical protein Kow0059_12360 [Candidatus Sumerlaeia bacterium]
MGKSSEPQGPARWKMPAAIVLLCTAAVIAMHQFARLSPEPPSPPPLSTQWAKRDAQKIEEDFRAGLAAIGLSEKQLEALQQWRRSRPKGNDPEALRAHRQKLAQILTSEQLEQLKALQKNRDERRAELRRAQQERLKRMIGERDYERHQADMKRVREIRREKLAAQRAAAQPTPVEDSSRHKQ